jgi:hypothetical protein
MKMIELVWERQRRKDMAQMRTFALQWRASGCSHYLRFAIDFRNRALASLYYMSITEENHEKTT